VPDSRISITLPTTVVELIDALERNRSRFIVDAVGALYQALREGASGLRQSPRALVDEVRAVARRRVQRLVGRVSEAELATIDQALARCLTLNRGLGAR
jgi:mRNA-degrading endonuclease toxin of MazEF toxin-antitoxin module